VDSSGWLAVADERDAAHEAVRTARDRWLAEGGVLVTTDYVVDETLTLLRARLGLREAHIWWSHVEGSFRVRIEWMTPPRVERARTWFFGWKDQAYSFTDCTSFAVMRELKLTHVLTTDDHFRQAGFTVVPDPV